MFFIFQRNLDVLNKIKTDKEKEEFARMLQLLMARIFSISKRWLMYLLMMIIPFTFGFFMSRYFF